MKMFGLIQITTPLVNKTCLSCPLLPSHPPSSLVLPSCGWLRSCGLLPAPPPRPQSQRTPPRRLSSCRGPGLKHTTHIVNKKGSFSNIPGLCVRPSKSVHVPYLKRVCRGPPHPRLRCRGGERPLGSPAFGHQGREAAYGGFQRDAA